MDTEVMKWKKVARMKEGRNKAGIVLSSERLSAEGEIRTGSLGAPAISARIISGIGYEPSPDTQADRPVRVDMECALSEADRPVRGSPQADRPVSL